MKAYLNKYRGMFVGLAIGDTLGTVAEFKSPGEFEPITKPRAGGPFDLPLGYWTDDTSMALCLADSLVEKQGYDSYDVMEKYWLWRSEGYRSSVGRCFDIGNQTSAALNQFMSVGGAVIPEHRERLSSAGNGSIMRLAPVVIAAHATKNSLEETMRFAQISARETHYSTEAEAGTALFAALLFNAVEAVNKKEIFQYGDYRVDESFRRIAMAVARAKDKTSKEIEPSGYIIHSLEAAVWAFMNNDTFKAGALAAVNLGGDADTIGAIYGQLAGAFYGYSAIPADWRDVLYMEPEICKLSDQLAALGTFTVLKTRFEEDGNTYNHGPKLEVVHKDITTLAVDAIVNAANTKLLEGAGVCGAIFAAAGYEDMAAACQSIGSCEYGEAVITPGFKLRAKHVIHTVGPVYGQHGGDEADILQSCYWQSLRLAQDHRVKSIAFPLISTGVFGYPKEDAIKVALEAIKAFSEDNPASSIEQIILCAYSKEDARLICRLAPELAGL